MFFYFLSTISSERMSADECLAHKWLREESPVKSLGTSPNCEILLTDVLTKCIDNDDNQSINSNGSAASYLMQKLNNEYQQQPTEVNTIVTITSTTTSASLDGTVSYTNGTLTEQHHNGHKEFYLKEKSYKQTTSNCIQLNSDTNNKENIRENRNVSKAHATNGTDVRRQSMTSIGSSCVTVTSHSDSFKLNIIDETITTAPLTSMNDTLIHLPDAVAHMSNGVAQTTETTSFPDAPTTPKVYRKSESPTSVKNLVKKFQLDNSPCNNVDAIHIATNPMSISMDCTGAFLPKQDNSITSSGIVKKISEALATTSSSSVSPPPSPSSSSSSAVASLAPGKCACGKLPSSCCCHLLGLRGKSMVVIDNSIVC